MTVLFLTLEDVQSLHDEQLVRYGGSPGVRDRGLLFLGLNGWDVDDPRSELYEAMIAIATGTVAKAGLATLLESLAVPYPGDEQAAQLGGTAVKSARTAPCPSVRLMPSWLLGRLRAPGPAGCAVQRAPLHLTARSDWADRSGNVMATVVRRVEMLGLALVLTGCAGIHDNNVVLPYPVVVADEDGGPERARGVTIDLNGGRVSLSVVALDQHPKQASIRAGYPEDWILLDVQEFVANQQELRTGRSLFSARQIKAYIVAARHENIQPGERAWDVAASFNTRGDYGDGSTDMFSVRAATTDPQLSQVRKFLSGLYDRHWNWKTSDAGVEPDMDAGS